MNTTITGPYLTEHRHDEIPCKEKLQNKICDRVIGTSLQRIALKLDILSS